MLIYIYVWSICMVYMYVNVSDDQPQDSAWNDTLQLSGNTGYVQQQTQGIAPFQQPLEVQYL